MGKRFVNLLFAVVLVLLCGCDGNSTQTTVNSINTTNGVSLETTSTKETLPTSEEIDRMIRELAYQVPEYEGELLIPADPEREVYISLVNHDVDYYPNYWFSGPVALVITKEHYELEEIRVNIPMQTPYELSVYDYTDVCSQPDYKSQIGFGLSNYQYMYLQGGVDWHELGQLFMNAQASCALAEEFPIGSQEWIAYMKGNDAYWEVMNEYERQFKNMPEDAQLPQFHLYWLSLKFNDIGDYEETVETVEFLLGDKSYTVDIGQWRFHTELPSKLKACFDRVGLSQMQSIISAFESPAYNGGYVQLENAFTFTAKENIVVTGISQYGVEVGVVGARVQITGSADMDYYWDLQRPLELENGDNVNITLYLKDDRFKEYEVSISTFFVMDYELRGNNYGICAPCMLTRANQYVWDTYLMAFEGYNIGEYYVCHYVPYWESWIRELPEEWVQ